MCERTLAGLRRHRGGGARVARDSSDKWRTVWSNRLRCWEIHFQTYLTLPLIGLYRLSDFPGVDRNLIESALAADDFALRGAVFYLSSWHLAVQKTDGGTKWPLR